MAKTHYRVRLGGTLYNDAHWSIGLNYALQVGGLPVDGTGFDPDKQEDWRDAIRALNGGNIVGENLRSLLSAAGSIDYVRVSAIGADRKEALVSLIELAQPVLGTGAPLHPAQTSLTFSLLTARPGASYRGRVYWPALKGTLNSAGRLDSSALSIYAGEMADLVNKIGNAGDALALNTVPVVVSTTRDALTAITSCRVGNRLDIQRRRAESQKESYGSALVPQ